MILRYATSSEVSAYSLKGKLLYSTDPTAFSGGKDEDLRKALNGLTAYTISYDSGTAHVWFSYPVVIDGVKVGILRYAKDFSLLYGQSSRILQTILSLTLIIFLAAFLFSYLLSRHITIPLVKLSKASEEVRQGNLDVQIHMNRKDEIGQLAGTFNEMIGQLKRQIDRIEQDRDRLQKINRQRKRFFDNVTHELKTPLTSILGYAEIIRDHGEEDPVFFHKGMKHIVEESRRLHEMVIHLLNVSQETVPLEEQARVDAGQLMRDVCDAMGFKAQRYNKQINCIADEAVFVRAHSDKLRQLFINLIDNAIKYGYPSTAIMAKAERDGAFARFSIVNRGETIATEQLEQMVDHPMRTSKEEGSMGLGLSIAKSIVEAHEGRMKMISSDELTTVIVELPAWDPEGQQR